MRLIQWSGGVSSYFLVRIGLCILTPVALTRHKAVVCMFRAGNEQQCALGWEGSSSVRWDGKGSAVGAGMGREQVKTLRCWLIACDCSMYRRWHSSATAQGVIFASHPATQQLSGQQLTIQKPRDGNGGLQP